MHFECRWSCLWFFLKISYLFLTNFLNDHVKVCGKLSLYKHRKHRAGEKKHNPHPYTSSTEPHGLPHAFVLTFHSALLFIMPHFFLVLPHHYLGPLSQTLLIYGCWQLTAFSPREKLAIQVTDADDICCGLRRNWRIYH